MEASRVVRSIEGILERIPFDKPYLSSRLLINTDNLKDIPHVIRHFFDIAFIYTDEAQFEACCILKKSEKTYTIIIIIRKSFEDDFKKQEETNNFLSRNYTQVCKRRELYCHEVCHLIAIIRAYPGYLDAEQRIFIRRLTFSVFKNLRGLSKDKEYANLFKRKFEATLKEIHALKPFALTLSLDIPGDSPADFDRDHFPCRNEDELNYFKLFSELMMTDKKIRKVIGSLPDNCNQDNVQIIEGKIDLARYIKDFLHVDFPYLRRTPEKRKIIIDAIQKLSF